MSDAKPYAREQLDRLQHLLDTGDGTLNRDVVRRLLATARQSVERQEQIAEAWHDWLHHGGDSFMDTTAQAFNRLEGLMGSIEGGGLQITSKPGSSPVEGKAVKSRSPSDLDSPISPAAAVERGLRCTCPPNTPLSYTAAGVAPPPCPVHGGDLTASVANDPPGPPPRPIRNKNLKDWERDVG